MQTQTSRWSSRDALHALVVSSNILAFILVQLEVPDPYLDEIFHIPQTQRYCDEDFDSWDPSITTPPGLYLLSAIPLMTVHIPCTTPLLRLTNLNFSIILIPFILSSIISSFQSNTAKYHRSRRWYTDLLKPASTALVITSFPLIFFFSNLFYTDVASLAAVLGCWALALNGKHGFASFVGALSLTVRQTNIVWVAFILATSILDRIKILQTKRCLKEDDSRDGTSAQLSDPLLRDMKSIGDIPSAIVSIASTIISEPTEYLKIVIPYIPTFLAFLAFLRWNGGIVLGHKDQHEPVLHLPQLLYFLGFSSLMLLPALFSEGLTAAMNGGLRVGLGSLRKTVGSVIVLAAMNIFVRYFTIYHPFLLADNRHYVFYLFNRILIPYPFVKYLLTPAYLGSLWIWIWKLSHSTTTSILWILGFAVCTAAVIVPTPLVEPRYFLIPLIILRLQLCNRGEGVSHEVPTTPKPSIRPDPFATPTQSSERGHMLHADVSSTPIAVQKVAAKDDADARVWMEHAWYTLINISTLGLFLLRKFRWEGWEGWMRFMW